MPILPIIDLLILLGWTSILIGGAIKAVRITTHYDPTFLGFAPMDLLMISGVFLLLALTLSARTWVKLNEPDLLGRRSAANRDRLDFNEGYRGNGGMAAHESFQAGSELRE